jgi:hypothetical protein
MTVPVAVVASRTEADLIVGLLRSNGLRAAVSADDAAGLEPQLQLQGVRVLVAPSDEASARRLLADADLLDRSGRVGAVSAWSPSFACMYYAALHPEEVVDLRRDNLVSLPAHGWGEIALTNSEPRSGTHSTDDD